MIKFNIWIEIDGRVSTCAVVADGAIGAMALAVNRFTPYTPHRARVCAERVES